MIKLISLVFILLLPSFAYADGSESFFRSIEGKYRVLGGSDEVCTDQVRIDWSRTTSQFPKDSVRVDFVGGSINHIFFDRIGDVRTSRPGTGTRYEHISRKEGNKLSNEYRKCDSFWGSCEEWKSLASIEVEASQIKIVREFTCFYEQVR